MAEDTDRLVKQYRTYIERGEFGKIPHATLERLASKVLVSTECCMTRYEVKEELGIIVVPVVVGVFFVRDWFAAFRDFFGGQSRSTQHVISEAGEVVTRQMRVEAFKRGGNAVVAIDIDFTESTGKGKSMQQAVATGTVLRIRRP